MRAYISTVITTRLEMIQMTKELHFNVQILSGRYNYTETQLLHKNAMSNLTNYLFLSFIIAKLEMTQTTWNNRKSQTQWDKTMQSTSNS